MNRILRGRPKGNGSLFHLVDTAVTTQRCQGLACFVARNYSPMDWADTESQEPRVYCLGSCYEAPASALSATRPDIRVACDTPVVLSRLADGSAPALSSYLADDGYSALAKVLDLGPAATIAEIELSGLRGRGGADFPTSTKWQAARAQPAHKRVIVINADEGDPGAYIDRFLMEGDPHAVLEGMAIAAVAVGAEAAYIYIRREYPAALASVRKAVSEAEHSGILGCSLLGNGPPLTVTVVEGKGSYVCGEETALLNALEGRRPTPRVRPPYPAQHGLFGVPTVVNNVETVATVPWILRNGGKTYAAMGLGTSRGTKVVSLNSLFCRPGLYEVELGVPVRQIVQSLGGGLVHHGLRGVVIGGPLAGVLPLDLLDIPLASAELHRAGAGIGHGGIVAFDATTSIAELVHHVFRFGSYESCGACVPCRVGAARMESLFSPGMQRTPADRNEWRATISALGISLCGHGTGLADFAESIQAHYGSSIGEDHALLDN